ncbi:Uma2 family endonuclease [Sorangium sp. So ce590]|uniref:Uma2 family endonuclease n=1 Tax=Sorangium sp. So ce590 TaxID=3133317 RepID=UPI003F604311
MVAVAPLSAPSTSPSGQGEQRFVMSNVSWDEYVALRKLLDDHPGLRMTYCEGVLELMSPSADHEDVKTRIGRLVELWALARRVRVYGYGSTTYRRKARQRGLEPDECYCVGKVNKKRPDIAIEVFITSGGIDKLDVYRGLEVPEVWIWKDGRISVHLLGEGGYEQVERSGMLPELDLGELSECARIPDQADAVDAYWERLTRRG